MTKKILIVDDAQFMRMLLKDIIISMGHEVIGEAENGADAVKKYQELKPDLVTMDIVMPIASGLDGLKGIKKINPDAKVIMVTAIDHRKSIMEAIMAGASDFIIKPFEADRVKSSFEKVFAK